MIERESMVPTAREHRANGEPRATAPDLELVKLQRTAGNHAVTRTLMRQQHPGAETLPRPGEQPAHQQAFDAFVTAVCANSDPAGLEAARTACDGPAQSIEQTLDFGGHKLVVDQRNRTAVLTRIRWRAMDRIHELSETHGATERTAADEAARTAARTALLDSARPYLTFLRGSIQDPQSSQNRFEHWYDVVQRSVLRVLELEVVEGAQRMGTKEGGAFKTRGDFDAEGQTEITRMGEKAWCGAFADLAVQQAGIDTAAKPGALDGERGILTFMNYQDELSAKKKIRDGDRTVSVRDFHAARNSLRKIQVIANVTGTGFSTPGGEAVSREAVQVNPGDILLLDRSGGNRPDHVMIATSSDVGAMSHIGGNETSVKRGAVFSGGAFDIRHQPDAISPAQQRPYDRKVYLIDRKAAHEKDATKPWTAADEQELAQVERTITEFEAANPKQSRIAAVCRFSIVDFEQHDYV